MIEAIILGVVQGLTEFLPISSTAHLILFPWFFNWDGIINTLTFDIALHAGTLIALIFCFWRDWVDLLIRRQRLFGLIMLASFPAGLAGFFLNDFVEHSLRSPLIISFTLVSVGILMLVAERSKKNRDIKQITFKDVIIIGVAQAFAIIPGVSRSGITISASLFRGLEREAAARFSFLLSTPIIAGATLLHTRKALNYSLNHDYKIFIVGIIVSFITGYFAIKFLLYFLKRYPLNIFAYYRFILSIIIITGVWLKN